MAVTTSAVISLPSREVVDRARHRIALRLLPFLFTIYIFNYLDRTSVAYAAIGMARDLGFSDRVFGLGIGVFFISYVALQIPGALLVERWSARRMISITDGRLGIADFAHRFRAYSGSTLRGALSFGRGRSRFLPRRHRLSEPLVHRRGPRQGHR